MGPSDFIWQGAEGRDGRVAGQYILVGMGGWYVDLLFGVCSSLCAQ